MGTGSGERPPGAATRTGADAGATPEASWAVRVWPTLRPRAQAGRLPAARLPIGAQGARWRRRPEAAAQGKGRASEQHLMGSGRVFVFRRACSVQAGGAHLLQVRKSAPQPSDGGDRAEPAGGPTRRPNVRPGGLRLTQGRPKRGVNETARGRRQGTQSRMFLKQH